MRGRRFPTQTPLLSQENEELLPKTMNAVEIESAVSDLAAQPFDAAEFPYSFLAAVGNKENGPQTPSHGQQQRL